ncbi:MAG: carbohydrate ABC transporter permease [Saccharofermentans sp.]|jgi:multiple sugar transport system permease protein|nr:carbohydrate ABC transporter permease [Mageeibacillus sp.]MCI1263518.1 carbohydrate ABC transporter permease [Saccharofermentans sp.]MCI1275122.1 carbohydrate ABC transporter permease [Saccharofermentans sp.]MCI2044144.1 carbohydrate ABC transporter permease [Mageeibacillus sp.]
MSTNEPKLKSKSGSIAAYSTLVYVVVIFFSILAILPFWFMFMSATWPTSVLTRVIKLYPNPNLFKQLPENWTKLTERATFSFPRGFYNSFVISISATVLTVYFSALTAYALSVYNFKGRKVLFAVIVGVMMVPTAVNITGFYRLMNAMNLIGTKWPLILPAIAAPSTVFFIKQYLDTSLSKEIIEASRIDGAGEFYTFNRICLPIMTPALATQAIFSFLGSWNNFFAPSILLSRPEDKTLPLMVAQLYGDRFVDYGAIYVGLSASILPIIIVYAFMQRYIISGVAAGGVKE